MKIDRIVIKNFRSFELLDLNLLDNPTCVIGENNTGKTALLHAIRLCIDANLPSTFRSLTANDIHSTIHITSPEQVLIGLELSDWAGKVHEEALVGAWQHKPQRARLFYRFRPKLSVREDLDAEELAPGDLKLSDYNWEIIAGGDGSTDLADIKWDDNIGTSIRFSDLQSFLVVHLPALRDVEADLRQPRNSPLARLIGAMDIDDEEKSDLVDILKKANKSIAATDTVSQVAKAIDKSFKVTSGPAFSMDVGLGLAEPSFQAIVRALRILLSNHAMDAFDPSCNGLGLNNILFVSIWIEYFKQRLKKEETAGQIILFEEPEAHLHPQLQISLYQALKALPFQSILTTHSTHITATANLSSYVVLTQTGEEAVASCVPASDVDLGEDEIADLERYLDATKSTLLFARKVMLVEGPAELFLIPALVKQLLSIDLERDGITVIPIYGVHFEIYAKLFSENGLAKKCAIVSDGDLKPSDGDPTVDLEDDLPPPPNLKGLESGRVKVFTCKTTFERAVASPDNLEMFARAAEEAGATRTAATLRDAATLIESDDAEDEDKDEATTEARDLVLNAAKRIGKARFAQLAAKHVDYAVEVPAYIENAIEWLKE